MSSVRSVVVNSTGLMPCCVGESGMFCLILLRSIFSQSLDAEDRNDIGQ